MSLQVKTDPDFEVKNDRVTDMLFVFINENIKRQSQFIASIRDSTHLMQSPTAESEQLKKTLMELLEETEKVSEIQQKFFTNLRINNKSTF